MRAEDRNRRLHATFAAARSVGDDNAAASAFARLVEINSGLIGYGFKLIRKVHGGAVPDEDIRQEAQLSLVEAIDTWDPDKSTLGRWYHTHVRKAIYRLGSYRDGGAITRWQASNGETVSMVSSDVRVPGHRDEEMSPYLDLVAHEPDSVDDVVGSMWADDFVAAIKAALRDRASLSDRADGDMWVSTLDEVLKGRSVPEIATERGVSRQTVFQVIHKIRQEAQMVLDAWEAAA